jgi:hypothetical protein
MGNMISSITLRGIDPYMLATAVYSQVLIVSVVPLKAPSSSCITDSRV